MIDWIVSNKTVWSFECVWTNEWCLIELLVIYSNTWKHLTLVTYCWHLTKGYWIRNNQNRGWEWNGNLYTSTKYKTRQQSEEGTHC